MIREKTRNCFDLLELRRIAFSEIKLPKRKYMAARRCFHVKQISCQSASSLVLNQRQFSQFYRRRSSDTVFVKCPEYRIVISGDHSKVAILRKSHRSVSDITILSSDENLNKSQSKTDWSLKSSVLIGVTNDGKRLVFTRFSSKIFSKVKSDIKIDIIGVNFDAFDGFYLEESECAISICRSGLVCKRRLNGKQSDTIMAVNDNTLSVESAHLNADRTLLWLDFKSSVGSHTFIAVDVHNFDVLKIIESDLCSVDKFSDNPLNRISLIVVKSNPINGKLVKVIDFLTDCQEKRIPRFFDQIFDIDCVRLTTRDESLDQHLYDGDVLLVLVTRSSFDVYVEYKVNNVWNKQMLFLNGISASELCTIRIINVIIGEEETIVTLLVIGPNDGQPSGHRWLGGGERDLARGHQYHQYDQYHLARFTVKHRKGSFFK